MSELKTTFEWNEIPWRKLERKTFKLQKRIFQASQRGDTKNVHKLQKMLMNSRSSKMLAVRRVTQDNQGKKTAGIDGVKSLTPKQRAELVSELRLNRKAKPTRRVWIPKPGTEEKRPLGIPVMYDRAIQALVKLALEPEWEARFEPNSFGFRPGRSCHDAVEAIFTSIKQKPKYVLDADIAKCFDRIDHTALLNKLGTIPILRRVIKAWLKAGVMEQGKGLFPTKEGTPQGGVISPLLSNIALHGLENRIKQAFPRRYPKVNGKEIPIPTPDVVRYADDFVIMHRDLSIVKEAQEVVAEWLSGIGLELKPSKTKITHTLIEHEGKVGFNFLGFNIRQYAVSKYNSGKSMQGYKTLIKPSEEKVRLHQKQIGEIMDTHQGSPQYALVGDLNSIIRGWCNYYSTVVSKDIFGKMEHLTYKKLLAWAKRRHPNKGIQWIVSKYWMINKGEGWTFADIKGDKTLRLLKHKEVPITRHLKVQSNRSPYDGDWSYWATRAGKHPELPRTKAMLLKQQKGKCQHCGAYFSSESLLEVHHLDKNRKNNKRDNLALLHRHCHDTVHSSSTHQAGIQELDEF